MDGPSDISGIKKNDVIISMNGNLVKSLQDFYLYLWNIPKWGRKSGGDKRS